MRLFSNNLMRFSISYKIEDYIFASTKTIKNLLLIINNQTPEKNFLPNIWTTFSNVFVFTGNL